MFKDCPELLAPTSRANNSIAKNDNFLIQLIQSKHIISHYKIKQKLYKQIFKYQPLYLSFRFKAVMI